MSRKENKNSVVQNAENKKVVTLKDTKNEEKSSMFGITVSAVSIKLGKMICTASFHLLTGISLPSEKVTAVIFFPLKNADSKFNGIVLSMQLSLSFRDSPFFIFSMMLSHFKSIS